MSQRFDVVLRWGPRVLGLLVCFYLGLFTLDAFAGDVRFREALPDLLVHGAPVAVLLGVVALSWRWEWVGGFVFTALAIGYAYQARSHPDWIAVISVPLFAVGALFTWSWMNRRGRRRVHS